MQFSLELRKIANNDEIAVIPPPQPPKLRFEHWLVTVIVNSQ